MGTERPTNLEIFQAAADIADADQRAAYLRQACAGDPAVQAEIEKLLEHDRADDSLLDRSTPGLGATLDRSSAERLGMQIGLYRLVDRLGSGGMGVVFLAEQTEPVQRQVALKIIRPGMDTELSSRGSRPSARHWP